MTALDKALQDVLTERDRLAEKVKELESAVKTAETIRNNFEIRAEAAEEKLGIALKGLEELRRLAHPSGVVWTVADDALDAITTAGPSRRRT
jgi:hypothetical protein